MQPLITIHRPAGRAGPCAPVPQPSVCFIHTPCLELRDDRLEPPLGLLSMATLVRSKGYRRASGGYRGREDFTSRTVSKGSEICWTLAT
jgi:hypothetical protein